MRRAILEIIFLLNLCIMAVAPGSLRAAPELPIPPLTGRVMDLAHLLSSEQTTLLAERLANAERQFGYQLVVVTLPDLQSYPIEEWGLQLGRRWGIGQKGTNNGILLIVAPNDRQVRIEVGYGLEGLVPDALAHIIIQRLIVPYFKSGNYAGGIESGVNALITSLSGDGQKITEKAAQKDSNIDQFVPFIFFTLFVFMVILVRRSNRRYGRWSGNGLLPLIAGSAFRGRDRRGGGGGGFSGGGGSFGGGGASGRW